MGTCGSGPTIIRNATIIASCIPVGCRLRRFERHVACEELFPCAQHSERVWGFENASFASPGSQHTNADLRCLSCSLVPSTPFAWASFAFVEPTTNNHNALQYYGRSCFVDHHTIFLWLRIFVLLSPVANSTATKTDPSEDRANTQTHDYENKFSAN